MLAWLIYRARRWSGRRQHNKINWLITKAGLYVQLAAVAKRVYIWAINRSNRVLAQAQGLLEVVKESMEEKPD